MVLPNEAEFSSAASIPPLQGSNHRDAVFFANGFDLGCQLDTARSWNAGNQMVRNLVCQWSKSNSANA